MASFRLIATTALVLALTTMTLPGHAQNYTVLYNFGSNGTGPNDPHFSGIIAQGRDGNLYTTAPDTWTGGLGTAFKLTPAGSLTVLHSFNGNDGQATESGLTLASDGNYYGTTVVGGLHSHGTVFKMSAAGVITTLYNFSGGADGGDPCAPPIEGFDGNFYGTTAIGGIGGNNGTIYKITPAGVFTTLHSFGFPGQGYPNAPLLQGSDGYLYGTTFYGGSHGAGTIFKISPFGSFTTLFNFDGAHGNNPFSALIEATYGTFYGAAASGGTAGGGVLFKITSSGTFSVLHNFTCGYDGCNQVGGLMQATDGNIYGTNNLGGGAGWGVLFRITPSGNFSVLHDFDWDSGASPQVPMVQHTNGKLYGDTAVGGSITLGAFYSFDIGMPSFVRLLPDAANVGSTVGVLGQGLTGTHMVSFNGISAAFTVVSDTYLIATVPAGATTGSVAVSTSSGTLSSDKKFLVGIPTLPQSADLTLRSIPYPTPPVQGGLLNYAFKVWNNTSDVAWHEVLTTQVPAGTTFSGLTISGTAGVGSCTHPSVGATGPVVCHEGSGMAPGTTWTVRMTVKVTAPAGTVITESAKASSDNLGSSTVNVSNTVH